MVQGDDVGTRGEGGCFLCLIRDLIRGHAPYRRRRRIPQQNDILGLEASLPPLPHRELATGRGKGGVGGRKEIYATKGRK